MVIPYFFFTVVLAVPKALMNHLSIADVLLKSALGNGSWFVSSLIVAELAFISMRFIKSKYAIYITETACLLLAYLLTDTDISLHHNYWNFHNALIGLFFMCLGYQYHQSEQRFRPIHRLSSTVLLLILFISIKIYVLYSGTSLLIEPVNITSYPIFVTDTIIGILLLITVAKHLPNSPWLSWTGRHSLVYYFFCGAVPMAVSKALALVHLPYVEGHYYLIPLVFILIYASTSAVAWLSYRYLPFL